MIYFFVAVFYAILTTSSKRIQIYFCNILSGPGLSIFNQGINSKSPANALCLLCFPIYHMKIV